MTTITPVNGAQFFIGPAEAAPLADKAAYAALTYVKVKNTESFGDFGDQAQPITFTATDDSRVQKTKGARDAGDMTVTVAYVPSDPGQVAMDAAQGTNQNYAFKLTLSDTPINGTSPTTTYLFGMVTGNRRQYGSANNVIRISYTIALNAAPIEDDAH